VSVASGQLSPNEATPKENKPSRKRDRKRGKGKRRKKRKEGKKGRKRDKPRTATTAVDKQEAQQPVKLDVSVSNLIYAQRNI